MKKNLLIFLVIFFFFSIIFCGCFESKPKTETEKLIGTWIAEDSHYRRFIFKPDGTCLINDYEAEGTFYIHKEGQLVINQTNPHVVYIYNYKLSNSNKRLDLTNVETDDYHTYIKQD